MVDCSMMASFVPGEPTPGLLVSHGGVTRKPLGQLIGPGEVFVGSPSQSVLLDVVSNHFGFDPVLVAPAALVLVYGDFISSSPSYVPTFDADSLQCFVDGRCRYIVGFGYCLI